MPIPTKNGHTNLHARFASEKERLSECLNRVVAAENAIHSARELLFESWSAVKKNGFKDDSFNGYNGTGTMSVAEQSVPPNPIIEFQKSLPTRSYAPTKSFATSRGTGTESVKSRRYLNIKSATCTTLGSGLPLKIGELRQKALAAAEKWSISESLALKCFEAFTHADKDDSGTIEVSELRSLMEEVAGCTVSDSEYKALLHKFDGDASGNLDFDEFLMVFVNTPMQHVFKLEEEIGKTGDEARARMQSQRLDPMERIRTVGVPRTAIKRFIRKELTEADACLAFPWAVALFFCFTLAVFLHVRIDRLYAIDRAVSYDIYENANFACSGAVPFENCRMGHKNIEDVNSHGDFWSWFNLGLVPLFWPEGIDLNEARMNVATSCQGTRTKLQEFGWDQSAFDVSSERDSQDNRSDCPDGSEGLGLNKEFFGTPHTPSYLLYYTIVGGLRLRQERTGAMPCPSGKAVHSGQCVPDPGYWLKPEMRSSMKVDPTLLDAPGGETIYLLSGQNRSYIRKQLRELEDLAWLNPYTAKVELLYTMYNAHEDILTGTFISFYMNRGGHIYKLVEPVSLRLNPYDSWLNYVFDFAWLGLVMQIFFSEGRELIKTWQKFGFRSGTQVYMNLGNAIDWISVAYSFVIIGFWMQQLVKLGNLSERFKSADVGILGSWANEDDRRDFFDRVEELIRFHHFFRTLVSFYPFVIVSRFFKAFASQPRLAMVTNTLSRASVDIAHYLVVFSSIFMIFTSSAQILFGQELLEFANFGRSLNTVFRIMLGDYGWVDAMLHVGRLEAGVWFWSFMWLMNLIMLNMMLAIIMDVYTAVKGEIGNDTETLISQTLEICYRAYDVYMGRCMWLSDILDVLDPTYIDGLNEAELDRKEGNLTLVAFMSLVPGLKEHQAKSILLDALKLAVADEREFSSLTDSAHHINEINNRTKHLHWFLEKTIHLQQYTADLILSTSKAEREGRRKLASALRPSGFFDDDEDLDDDLAPGLASVVKKLEMVVSRLDSDDARRSIRKTMNRVSTLARQKNVTMPEELRHMSEKVDPGIFATSPKSLHNSPSRMWDGCSISRSAQEASLPFAFGTGDD